MDHENGKKNILAIRGSFRPVTKVNEDMFDKSIEIMSHEVDYDENQHLTLFEITLSNLKSSNGDVNEEDFLPPWANLKWISYDPFEKKNER